MTSSSGASHIKYVVFVGLLLISNIRGMMANTVSSDNASSYPVEIFTDASSSYPVETFAFTAPHIKYDVFVSFRGTDIRQGFLSHLIKALSQKQIFAFVDDKLERGDEISQALLRAIERSLISLIIFSPDYASSSWCLEELVKIAECREKDGQTVIPVFYEIDPSEVRHQKGTFANAFAEHEKKYDNTKVQIWRSALRDSANLSGFHSSNFRNDGELVQQIVKFLLMRLNDMHRVTSKGLVGIGKPIAHLELLLRKESKDVHVIGIWGLGGVGKTTIAEEVYNRMCSEYEGCCFLANIREESTRHGIISLKKKLFSTLLDEQDLRIDIPNGLPGYVEKRLGRMKVLIVLDDVNDSDQLDILIGAHDRFGPGSRIIVTTRDKQVLAKEVDDIYEVEALDFEESLQLFIMNAFKQNHICDMEYCKLSRRVVCYAKGIPLVLKVLAGLLHGKDKDVWESQLEKLKKMPNKKVYDIMLLSYDDLDREEQNIFLDIACIFHGLNLKLDYIKLLLKEDHDYSVAAGIERLKDKALITISEHHIVYMHDIIQEMALEIARGNSIEYPKNQQRLLDPDDIYQVLENKKGSDAIRSIAFNLSAIEDLQLSPHVFAKMRKLQYLYFHSKVSKEGMYHPQNQESFPNKGLYLPQGLESLPNELRYLSWMHYPLESLPMNFSAENLVILDLPYNRVEKLWDGVQNLENLKVVKLRNSLRLTRLPDFSKARNLEVLDLRQSQSLACVHTSVFGLNKLETLDLGGCFSLRQLRSNIRLSSLRHLSLSGCVRLEDFSVTSKNLKVLNLELTGIRELPSSIGHQSKLEILRLALSNICYLPQTIKNLPRLRYLDVRYCWYLRTLPELPPSLEGLDASDCSSLETVLFPSTAKQQLNENRKSIMFWNCLKLNQYSLEAIGLNAQINIMKLAYQHLSALAQDYYENNDTSSTYVYPGSSVPKWLVYRASLDYINIDISAAAPYLPLFGFIFCFIIPPVPSEGFTLMFSISVGEGEGDGINVFMDRPYEKIESDHVCLMYNQRLTRFLNSRSTVENQQRLKIKVTAASLMGKSEHVLVTLKGFGISPIRASEYHNFVQQMQLGETSPKFPISHFHQTTKGGSLAMIGSISCESFCLEDKKNLLDFFIQRINYDEGCWKFSHHVFTKYSHMHIVYE